MPESLMMVLALSASLLSSPLIVSSAHAQDDADFGPSAKAAGQEDLGQVREINRGFYGKASAGVALYLLDFSAAVDPGTNVMIAFGQDFVDSEKQSMAWEIAIGQGVHNGANWYDQAEAIGPKAGGIGCRGNDEGGEMPCTEGDLRTYTLQANYEFSVYPVRRFGIGLRAGAGVLYSPLLIEPGAYGDEVVDAFGINPELHNSPKPIVFAGPTFEYYTKLSHFSVGVDIDVVYGIGWDLGLNATGALKYTF